MATSQNLRSTLLGLALSPLAAVSLAAQTQNCPVTQGGEMPLKYTGGTTLPAITPCDLMNRLYIYADDSMMGRKIGTEDNLRATAYIERELRKLGLKPAGDDGGYFQYIGFYASRTLDSASTITVGGKSFSAWKDFTSNIQSATKTVSNATVIYGGVAGDTLNILPPEEVRGKILVLSPAAPGAAGGGFGGRGAGGRGGAPSAARQALMQSNAAAAMVLTVAGDQLPVAGGAGGRAGGGGTFIEFNSDTLQGTGQITTAVAAALLGKPLDQVTKGMTGLAASMTIKINEVRNPSRNVVAVLPGTDAKLKEEYVLISAHNDHIGHNLRPNGNVIPDADSLHIWNKFFVPQGADDQRRLERGGDQSLMTSFKAAMDSVRKLRPTPRADSIANGADDDGSGSMTVLEIAEQFAKGTVKPKRSIIFVWQTGEESGMLGSGWFATHPTVPRDKIVADINMDMVGRGFASDATGSIVVPDSTGRLVANGEVLKGGTGYLQLVGSRRLSKEFGDLVETVNKEEKLGFNFDYAIDANGHPQRIYCRSDHWSYAKYGIPVVFMTTGGHADYHQYSDEPQYINYKHMSEVGKLSFALAMRVANLDHRVSVDKAGPFDPTAACVQ